MESLPAQVQPDSPKSQYHHFIPRFILRNFAHAPKKSPKQRNGKGSFRSSEPMLYTIDLSKPTVEIKETSVGRTFGLIDMYRDFEFASNQMYLEQQLSKLESRAGEVISKIRKEFEAKKEEVWITRPERDILRKFLFIMKYRSSNMRKRFYHQKMDDYSSDDREKLLEYMKERGFKKPIDVWFDNIKAMLELKMDPKGEWVEVLMKRSYPYDAIWFILHIQSMYLALCTTSISDDEYLLTENGYGIHEGPVSLKIDRQTYEVSKTCYTEYHVFAAISPNLMIVLRSSLFPIPEEDIDSSIKRRREELYRQNSSYYNNFEASKSMLADLPIRKARNSYTKMTPDGIRLLDGEDGTLRSTHKFCFRFFPLTTEYVDKINAIMLEESTRISTIVFKSYDGALKAIKRYLEMPPSNNMKTVFSVPGDPRLTFLKKLEQTAKEMGSSVTTIYRTEDFTPDQDEIAKMHNIMCEEMLLKEPGEFSELYKKMGGNATTIFTDMEQAARMLNMRIKIDVWTTELDEDFRDHLREELRLFFCELPVRRVWCYLKRVRHMIGSCWFNGALDLLPLDFSVFKDGPEDCIARALHVVHGNSKICRLMWFATLNDIHLSKATKGPFNLQCQRILNQRYLGSIHNCGIPEIEEKARLCSNKFRTTQVYENRMPFFPDDETIETLTRCAVQKEMKSLFGNKLSHSNLDSLEHVLFKIIYNSTIS